MYLDKKREALEHISIIASKYRLYYGSKHLEIAKLNLVYIKIVMKLF